jgi:hypothetical protein
MSIRRHSSRWLSPSLFALIALCFLLPFATVSCDSASTTFTGIQLVTRTVPSGGVLSEAPDCSSDISTCVERDAANTATVALLAALAGVLLGALGIVRGPGWCGALGGVALLVLPFQGPFFGPNVNLHSGYASALLLFVGAGLLHVARAWRRHRRRKKPKPPSPATVSHF